MTNPLICRFGSAPPLIVICIFRGTKTRKSIVCAPGGTRKLAILANVVSAYGNGGRAATISVIGVNGASSTSVVYI